MRYRDRFPIPAATATKISRRAVAIARANAPKRTGEGARMLRPMQRIGEVGIIVPAEAQHMIFQDQGIKSFKMEALAGKTIPIRLPSGQMIFRRCNAEDIGRRRITARDEKGRILESKLSWTHPGLAPKHFVDKAIRQAIDEWHADVDKRELLGILMDNPEFASFVADIRHGNDDYLRAELRRRDPGNHSQKKRVA